MLQTVLEITAKAGWFLVMTGVKILAAVAIIWVVRCIIKS